MISLRSTLLSLAAVLLLGCGHVIYQAPNHACKPFDFKHPPRCAPDESATSGEEVAIRYLGAGGVAIRWRGQILLTAPFFSNYGFPRVPFGRLKPNRDAIKDGMASIPPDDVGAILAGHSHYDHLGDLPIVAEKYAPRAGLYVNDSGLNLLAHALGGRVKSLERSLETPVQLHDAAGRSLPRRACGASSTQLCEAMQRIARS